MFLFITSIDCNGKYASHLSMKGQEDSGNHKNNAQLLGKISQKNKHFQTTLSQAASRGSADIVEKLLAAGIDINAKMENG